MRRNKKAALSLSMNAIVTIVIAVAMLGVGMLVVSLVRAQTSNIFGGFDDIDNPSAGASNTLGISTVTGIGNTKIAPKPGDVTGIKVAYFNANDRSTFIPWVECKAATDPIEQQSSFDTVIDKDSSDVFELTLKMAKSASQRPYTCRLRMYDVSNGDASVNDDGVITINNEEEFIEDTLFSIDTSTN